MENSKGYLIYPIDPIIRNSVENNPKFIEIMNCVEHNFENQNYTVYRAAGKITTLKNLFFTSYIPFKLVLQVLERNHLNQSDDRLPIYPKKLIKLLYEIYLTGEKLNYFEKHASFDTTNAVRILANFFWNIYDMKRNQPISLFELKETFLILCEVNTFEDMKSACFLLIADHNRCISRYRFECLVKVLMKILTFMGESDAYGIHKIIETVDQCFAQSPGIMGLNEYQFHCLWYSTETNFLIFANLLALIKRIKDTEELKHNIPCSSCGLENIQGIRFKCQACKNLSLCMKCFAIGFEKGKHSIKHRVHEVFAEEMSQKSWTHYITEFFNSVCLFKYNNINRSEDTNLITKVNDSKNYIASYSNVRFDEKTLKEKVENSFGATNNCSTIVDNLENIAEKLGKEKETIDQYKNSLNKMQQANLYEFLDNHGKIMLNLTNQLKCLIDQSRNMMYPLSSTPNHRMSIVRTIENLSKSIHGSEINKTYLEANKSDYSISDLSSWFHQKICDTNSPQLQNNCLLLNEMPADRTNYCQLLNKVKEIIESGDGYTDTYISDLDNLT